MPPDGWVASLWILRWVATATCWQGWREMIPVSTPDGLSSSLALEELFTPFSPWILSLLNGYNNTTYFLRWWLWLKLLIWSKLLVHDKHMVRTLYIVTITTATTIPTFSSPLSQSVPVAIVPQAGWLKQIFISYSSGGCKSEIKVPAQSGSWWEPPSWLTGSCPFLNLHIVERKLWSFHLRRTLIS